MRGRGLAQCHHCATWALGARSEWVAPHNRIRGCVMSKIVAGSRPSVLVMRVSLGDKYECAQHAAIQCLRFMSGASLGFFSGGAGRLAYRSCLHSVTSFVSSRPSHVLHSRSGRDSPIHIIFATLLVFESICLGMEKWLEACVGPLAKARRWHARRFRCSVEAERVRGVCQAIVSECIRVGVRPIWQCSGIFAFRESYLQRSNRCGASRLDGCSSHGSCQLVALWFCAVLGSGQGPTTMRMSKYVRYCQSDSVLQPLRTPRVVVCVFAQYRCLRWAFISKHTQGPCAVVALSRFVSSSEACIIPLRLSEAGPRLVR